MKALLVSESEPIKELLSFQITSKFPITIKESNSPKAAVEFLKKEAVDLLIAPFTGLNSVLVSHLKERKEPLPVIFFYDSAIVKPEKNDLGGIVVVGLVDNINLSDGVVAALKEYLSRIPAKDTDENLEYCPIRTNLLIRATPLKSDIYIRLSKAKFVKLFETGDEFTASDLQKYYDNKKVEYLYLKRTETAEFIEKFRRELDLLLAKKDLTEDEGMKAVEMSQEAVHELVHRIGFQAEVQEVAKKNVQLMLKMIGNQPKLSNLLQRVLKEGNYLSQHSTLLAHIACCVAKEMEWGSEATFNKLVLASFMHDISLTDAELAKVNSLKELEGKKSSFNEQSVKEYPQHPLKSAEVVRSFQEIPADVDLIVLHHHEKPSGSGFPRGLSHNFIAPLASVFIVSHDLTQEILFNQNFNLQHFVEEKKAVYNQGNFKKVMQALEKIKL